MDTLLNGKEAARLLLEILDRCRSSPLCLFWLKLPVEILGETEIGHLLIALCKYHQISLNLDRSFFEWVQERAQQFEKVDPDFFTVASKRDDAIENYKAMLASRRSQMRGEPFAYLSAVMPFCFQARKKDMGKKNYNDSLFFCFAHAEDGVRAMKKILSEGGYLWEQAGSRTFYHLMQIYEHRYDIPLLPNSKRANRLSYMMIDWEIMEGQMHGRFSHSELRHLCAGFPDWFVSELQRLGFLNRNQPLTGIVLSFVFVYFSGAADIRPRAPPAVVVKNKSRPAPGDDVYKHSLHVIVELAGVPTWTHALVFNEMFGPYTQLLQACKKAKTFVPFLDASQGKSAKDGEDQRKGGKRKGGVLPPPPPPLHAVGIDLKAMLNNGFAVPFSRKKADDPPSQLAYRKTYLNGKPVVVQGQAAPAAGQCQAARKPPPNPKPFEPSTPHDLGIAAGAPGHLSDGEAWRILYHGCFSIPKKYHAWPSPRLLDLFKAQRIQTAARSGAYRAASRGGDPPPLGVAPDMSEHRLPQWLQSELAKRGGIVVSASAAKNFLSQIVKLSPSLAATHSAVRVSGMGMPCPESLSKAPSPVVHYHRSNGVILVYSKSAPHSPVYTRCTQCRVDTGAVGEGVTLLQDEKGPATQWLELTEASFASLVLQAKQGVCVCV